MNNKDEILHLFHEWNGALQTGDASIVTALYDVEGILLPTVSNQVRYTHDEISDYFESFLARRPQGQIDHSNVRLLGNLAINSGTYTFTFNDGSEINARYTFVYRWSGERWMILEHHSSQMPEQ